jgi:hypothetical protein
MVVDICYVAKLKSVFIFNPLPAELQKQIMQYFIPSRQENKKGTFFNIAEPETQNEDMEMKAAFTMDEKILNKLTCKRNP